MTEENFNKLSAKLDELSEKQKEINNSQDNLSTVLQKTQKKLYFGFAIVLIIIISLNFIASWLFFGTAEMEGAEYKFWFHITNNILLALILIIGIWAGVHLLSDD